MNPEEKKQRNYVIAGAVGGFLLPLAGLIGALIFQSRGDPTAARVLAIGAVAGLLTYVVVFGLL